MWACDASAGQTRAEERGGSHTEDLPPLPTLVGSNMQCGKRPWVAVPKHIMEKTVEQLGVHRSSVFHRAGNMAALVQRIRDRS